MNSEANNRQPLERFRSYLLLLARRQLQGNGSPQLDASDLVQQSLLEAHRQGEQFRGTTDAECAAWLRQILAHNLADADQALRRQKRDVGREISLQAELMQTTADLADFLVADQSSPSRKVDRQEDALLLADALDQLPDTQREALVLQYWHGMTLKQIGERLGRTPVAVAGLLKRGLQRLRQLLDEVE